MGNETIASQVGRAWRYQREGQADSAVKEFEKILRQDPDDIDANYGMGLAQRSAGHPQAVHGPSVNQAWQMSRVPIGFNAARFSAEPRMMS